MHRLPPTPLLSVVFVSFLTGLTLAPSNASADRRAFTHTYEYPTLAKGELELEFWNTQAGDTGAGQASTLDLQIEIEYGITNRWEISLYQTLGQAADGSGLGYGKTKLENRYRLAERGAWPVDVTLYLELAKPFGSEEVEVEPKLILARDFGRVTVALNVIGEIEIEDQAEFIPGFALGATYEMSPKLKMGLEVFGELEEEMDPMTGGESHELALSAGPAIGWSPTPKLWLASTLAAGLSDAADLEWRLIVGLGF
jgi:hypothetical protein